MKITSRRRWLAAPAPAIAAAATLATVAASGAGAAFRAGLDTPV